MTADVTLAPVGPGDADELLTLARAFHAEDGHPLDADGERAVREVCDGHPLACGFLVRRGGSTAGYLVLTLGYGVEYGGADVFLDDLYLTPESRGQGLGARSWPPWTRGRAGSAPAPSTSSWRPGTSARSASTAAAASRAATGG